MRENREGGRGRRERTTRTGKTEGRGETRWVMAEEVGKEGVKVEVGIKAVWIVMVRVA